MGDVFPMVLGTSTGAVTKSGAQAAPVIVVGSHDRGTRGDGFYALACGLVQTLAATPHGPQCVIMVSRNGGARPWSPSAEESMGG